MTNKEALQRGMAALESAGQIELNKGRTKATPNASASDALTEGTADADAEAWNMLRHLSTIA